MNALELRGLTKHYKDFTLGPLDLTLPGGTICGLIGENGAGKSTTIRLILDMVQRDGGTVTILGRASRTASVEPLFVAGLFYLLMNGAVSLVFSCLNRRMAYYKD